MKSNWRLNWMECTGWRTMKMKGIGAMFYVPAERILLSFYYYSIKYTDIVLGLRVEIWYFTTSIHSFYFFFFYFPFSWRELELNMYKRTSDLVGSRNWRCSILFRMEMLMKSWMIDKIETACAIVDAEDPCDFFESCMKLISWTS